MHDVWRERWEVQSMTDASKTYTVARKRDQTMGCSCPAWKFHKAPKVHCKHIISILEALSQVIRRGRIFLDASVTAMLDYKMAPANTFPSAAEVSRVIGKSNFDMQVDVKGEQFKVKRVFLEED